MKKYIPIILAVTIFSIFLSACSTTSNTTDTTDTTEVNNIEKKDEKIKIVTTIFPVYDWVREILGENLDNSNLTMLIDDGVDLHSYQPTVDDLIEVSECDVFIYIGGESDQWVEDALKNATNKDMIVINLMETLGDSVKTEEIVEGMQESEHAHDHDHDHEEDHDHDHDHESHHSHPDEHVWLSLKNAKVLTQEIADKLSLADLEHKEEYLENMTAYNEKLSNLDERYQEVVDNSVNKTLLFGDRFPFRYLVDDYGLDYYAAFSGCSAETEASFETITFLSNKMDELELENLLTIEGSDGKISETIVSNTKNKDQEILTMDSLQSTTAEDVVQGVTYLSVMEENLEVLEEALN